MSIIKSIRSRREANRHHRELQRAMSSAFSSGLRDELIWASQRDMNQQTR